MIHRVHSERGVLMFCDMHGHSRKHNVFMYGCTTKNPKESRLLPYILSQLNSNFSFESCRFGLQPDKEDTARIALFRELKVPLVYTLESSFGGVDQGADKGWHLNT